MPASQMLVAIGAGLTGAIFFATVLTGSLWAFALSYLAPLPLFMAGLALGVGGAAVAAASAAIVIAVAGSLALGFTFAVTYVAPALIMTRQALLRREDMTGRTVWYPAGALVLSLAGLAVVAYLALLVAFASAEGGLEGSLRATLQQAFRAVAPPDAPPGTGDALAALFARYAPGLMAVTWMQMIAVNGVLAQALLSASKRNLRPSPAMADIQLPKWLVVATAILALGAFFSEIADAVAQNLLIIALATFLFAGFAVIHAVSARWNYRRLWLGVIYTVTFAFPWPVLLIAGLGIIETSIGLRRRAMGRLPGT
jgi:hypothetical protein